MTCPHCQSYEQRPHYGGYQLRCLECCARLVLSAHPSKLHAMAMLAAIARFRDSPGREEILACVRQMMEKRRSEPPKCGTGYNGDLFHD